MVEPYFINIESWVIDDLKERLEKTRWTDEIENAGWEYGTNKRYLKELCRYWQQEFNWTKQQQYLNSFHHNKATVDGIDIHFLHEKGKSSNAIPLLLTHGWPDSFIRFLKIIPLLTKADENMFSFDVIVPSIPGYGFSEVPTGPGMNPKKIADLFTKLMCNELGYSKFLAHGGDWGGRITEQISLIHPEALLGIHLTDIPFEYLVSVHIENMTDTEKKYRETAKQWQQAEGIYSMMQGTKPQTLAYGLNDSPAGLAAWMIEKFRSWSDCDGNIEICFTKDELLTNLTIYWATQTINSAFRIYYETVQNSNQLTDKASKKNEVPAAIAVFPKDPAKVPKELAGRFFNVQQWAEMPKAGTLQPWNSLS